MNMVSLRQFRINWIKCYVLTLVKIFINVKFIDLDCMNKISQVPVVLIPIHFDRSTAAKLPSTRRSIVIRPFISNDFMTGIAAIPGKHISEEVKLI